MLILAFDTCFGNCSAAVFRSVPDATTAHNAEPHLLAALDEPMAVGHAERLLPMIAEVMAQAGVVFADLDAIAVTLGPGTFTGVRTAISAARALALATGLPVLATTSLALIATGVARWPDLAATTSRIAVCMDAGKGQIYAQLFAIERSPDITLSETAHAIAVGDALLTTVDQVRRAIEPPATMVVGTAAASVASAAIGADRTEPDTTKIACEQPSARDMRYARMSPVAPVHPLYLRQPDAIPSADTAFPRANP